MRRRGPALFLLAALAFPVRGAAGDALAAGDSHVTWDRDACSACHPASDSVEVEGRRTRPCRTFCESCHALGDGHHPVGAAVPARLPDPLLLTCAGTITCSTCHDVTRARRERTAWVSRSLVERVARTSRANRTYLLAARNDRGQLCRTCH